MKYAIVDLGSNTVRLSVYHVPPEGGFELLFSEKVMAGLVNYVKSGVLSQEGIDRACGVLMDFRATLRQFGMEEMRVFATASLRNIRNTEEAVAAIRRRVGVNVDVVPGDVEAELSYFGALQTIDLQNGALFDIGGGSTEIVDVREGHILRAQSLSIGSLSLFNRHVSKVWPKKEELAEIRQDIRQALHRAHLPEGKPECICGVGGTARAVLKIANAYYEHKPENRRLSPKELRELTELLVKKNRQGRDLILKVCPDRIHTILPGILLVDSLCEALGDAPKIGRAHV